MRKRSRRTQSRVIHHQRFAELCRRLALIQFHFAGGFVLEAQRIILHAFQRGLEGWQNAIGVEGPRKNYIALVQTVVIEFWNFEKYLTVIFQVFANLLIEKDRHTLGNHQTW